MSQLWTATNGNGPNHQHLGTPASGARPLYPVHPQPTSFHTCGTKEMTATAVWSSCISSLRLRCHALHCGDD